MKITDVQAHLLAIPLKEVDFPAPWVWGGFNQIIVEIQTDEGITGYGEAFGYGIPQAVAAAIQYGLRPTLIGADPRMISHLHDRMLKENHIYGRYGVTIFAISGIDIALWDIAGQCANLPLYRLLGGTDREKVPAYASLVRYGNRDELKAAILHARRAGSRMIKLHQLDGESLKIFRSVAGEEIGLTVDVNCAWTAKEALAKAREFAPYRLDWLEEPIFPPEDFRSLHRLGALTGIPLASGENACTVFQFQAMLEAEAVTYIQPSVIKVGGITEWRKVATLAELHNAIITPHSPYFGPGLVATIHLAATHRLTEWMEYLYVSLETSVFQEPPKFENGYLRVPQGPGLGLKIDPAVIREYRRPFSAS